jgi:hypothetical protein
VDDVPGAAVESVDAEKQLIDLAGAEVVEHH